MPSSKDCHPLARWMQGKLWQQSSEVISMFEIETTGEAALHGHVRQRGRTRIHEASHFVFSTLFDVVAGILTKEASVQAIVAKNAPERMGHTSGATLVAWGKATAVEKLAVLATGPAAEKFWGLPASVHTGDVGTDRQLMLPILKSIKGWDGATVADVEAFIDQFEVVYANQRIRDAVKAVEHALARGDGDLSCADARQCVYHALGCDFHDIQKNVRTLIGALTSK
jgi:hypothetical protein